MNPGELPLRDIHLPAEPGWWPPAPGWWAAGALVVLALALAAWWVRRRGQAVPRRVAREVERQARIWRERGDSRALLVGLSATLRRAAIALGGRETAAGLVGDRWRAHLNAPFDDRPFDEAPGALLLDAAWRPEPPELEAGDVTALETLCRRWARAAAAEARR